MTFNPASGAAFRDNAANFTIRSAAARLALLTQRFQFVADFFAELFLLMFFGFVLRLQHRPGVDDMPVLAAFMDAMERADVLHGTREGAILDSAPLR